MALEKPHSSRAGNKTVTVGLAWADPRLRSETRGLWWPVAGDRLPCRGMGAGDQATPAARTAAVLRAVGVWAGHGWRCELGDRHKRNTSGGPAGQ